MPLNDDQVRRYVLGLSDQTEKEEVEKAYFDSQEDDDKSWDAYIEVIEDELVEKYVFNRLTDEQLIAFEENFLKHPDEKVRAAREEEIQFMLTMFKDVVESTSLKWPPVEQTRKYFLGLMNDAERKATEVRHIRIASKEWHEEMNCMEDELIEDYLEGSLTEVERQAFEENYQQHPEEKTRKYREDKIQFVRSLNKMSKKPTT